MSDEEFKKSILNKIAENSAPKGPNILEMGMKALNFILTALVIWIFTVVSDTSSIVQSLMIKQDYTNDAIAKFEEFTSAPRFTESDFNSQLIPLRNQINSNTAELNIRTELFDGIDDEIGLLKSRVQLLEFKMDKLEAKQPSSK